MKRLFAHGARDELEGVPGARAAECCLDDNCAALQSPGGVEQRQGALKHLERMSHPSRRPSSVVIEHLIKRERDLATTVEDHDRIGCHHRTAPVRPQSPTLAPGSVEDRTPADPEARFAEFGAAVVRALRSWACRQAHILVDVPSRVILFSTDSCTLCISAKSLLAKRGVAFEEVNLAEDPELQAELAEVTGLTSFPQIIVDGETVGGLNELRGADKNGRLASWSSN
jgi:glutaredoxin 3